ncbi:MAG: hypothetical protein M3R03_06990 [Pseudomonadota bacterium]|nr:hypothetical protein [Pseudomonadota bacterium]
MRGRISLLESVAVAAVLMPAALAAQSTNTTAPATPTPAPATEGTAVGPPQLRDFNLNGTVTRPAQPATETPSPTPRAAPPRAAPPRAAPPPAQEGPARAAPVAREPVDAAPQEDPATAQAPVDLPSSTAAPSELETPVLPAPQPDLAPDSEAVAEVEQSDLLWWPWLAALLAVVLGAGFLWRRRRQETGERYAVDHDALGSLIAAPAAGPGDASMPLARDMPTVRPEGPSARPLSDPPPSAPALPVSPVVPVARPDGIIASGLKPELMFELEPVRAETDAAEGAALTFDLIVTNRGSAPARDVLIEAQLINANPQVDAAVGRFFSQPAGAGDRLPMIPPMSHVSIRTQLAAAAADLAPLIVEGRKLFVPVIALNAHYRWSGDELKVSSSFLVGRGDAEGGKMAPFRLDRGARSWSGLAARLHSSGLAS